MVTLQGLAFIGQLQGDGGYTDTGLRSLNLVCPWSKDWRGGFFCNGKGGNTGQEIDYDQGNLFHSLFLGTNVQKLRLHTSAKALSTDLRTRQLTCYVNSRTFMGLGPKLPPLILLTTSLLASTLLPTLPPSPRTTMWCPPPPPMLRRNKDEVS